MSTPTPLSLSSLVGPHTLYGVDRDLGENVNRYADSIRFQLGETTYFAVEGDNDGYRSSMDHIAATETLCVNRFAGVEVIARMSPIHNETVLELVHAKSGAVILRVGTENEDDYYPCWVATFDEGAL